LLEVTEERNGPSGLRDDDDDDDDRGRVRDTGLGTGIADLNLINLLRLLSSIKTFHITDISYGGP